VLKDAPGRRAWPRVRPTQQQGSCADPLLACAPRAGLGAQLGEPGVGKTAIAEGLAAAIVQRSSLDGSPLPEFLENKRVLQLDVGLIIAGAKERGELESRVTKLIGEIKEAGNCLLM
jgi:hypothetical protein